jgi:4-carboxymuconolactone decarboxylase
MAGVLLAAASRRVAALSRQPGRTIAGAAVRAVPDPSHPRWRCQNGGPAGEEQAMAESENMQKGRAMRTRLIGEKATARMNADVYADPLMDRFRDYAQEAVFGMLWTRPGLDLKTRALICVVSDTATHAWPELEIHLRMARRQGWSEDELAEALLHMGGYVGLPAVREALVVAKRLFAQMREEGEDQ